MEPPVFKKYEDKSILHIDFSGCRNAEDVLNIISRIKMLIIDKPQNSVLALSNMGNVFIDEQVINALKNLLVHNKSYVKKSALVGVNREYKELYKSMMEFSGRQLAIFNDAAMATDWLLDQRLFPRYKDPIIIEYKLLTDQSVKGEGIAKDISLGGVCIFADKKIDIRTVLLLRASIMENEPPIEMEGVVTWAGDFKINKDKPFLLGLQFQRISTQTHQKLFQYIIERSKEQIF